MRLSGKVLLLSCISYCYLRLKGEAVRCRAKTFYCNMLCPENIFAIFLKTIDDNSAKIFVKGKTMHD